MAKPKVQKLKYKGWLIQWNEENVEWDLFTPDELINPQDMREADTSISDLDEAKYFIDKY